MLSQKLDSYCLPGKLLFEDGEPLTFGDFMRGILTLRGSNQTTVKAIRLPCDVDCHALGCDASVDHTSVQNSPEHSLHSLSLQRV